MRTLLQDKFVGANGTALAAHSPNVGGPWTDDGPGLVIQSNKATGSDASGESTAPLGARTIDLTADFSLNGMDAGSTMRLYMTRETAGGGYLDCIINGEGKITAGASSSTNPYFQDEIVESFALSGNHRIQLQVTPGSQRILIDGKLVLQVQRYLLLAQSIDKLSFRITRAAGAYPLLWNLLVQGGGPAE